MTTNAFGRFLLSGAVAGPLLVLSVLLLGVIYFISSIEAERTARYRWEVAYAYGREAAQATPSTDGIVERFTYWTRGSLDGYLIGLKEGKTHALHGNAPQRTNSKNSSKEEIFDEVHQLSDGRTWRNVGIVHDRRFYDPQASPHFLSAVRTSDAVLTEDGMFFDQLRDTARNLGVTAESLGETRAREAAILWARKVALSSSALLLFMGLYLAIGLVLLQWLRRPSQTGAEPKHPISGPVFAGCLAWISIVFVIAFVGIDVLSACLPAARHGRTPMASSASSTYSPGIREQVDQLIDTHLMSFNEACEYDSRSMHRGIHAYFSQHPERRKLLVITGKSHAEDFERYESAR